MELGKGELVWCEKQQERVCKYVNSKRKTRGNVHLLLNGAGDLVTKNM